MSYSVYEPGPGTATVFVSRKLLSRCPVELNEFMALFAALLLSKSEGNL